MDKFQQGLINERFEVLPNSSQMLVAYDFFTYKLCYIKRSTWWTATYHECWIYALRTARVDITYRRRIWMSIANNAADYGFSDLEIVLQVTVHVWTTYLLISPQVRPKLWRSLSEHRPLQALWYSSLTYWPPLVNLIQAKKIYLSIK